MKVGQAIPTFDGVTAVCASVETPIGAMTVYGTIITWHGDKGPGKDAPAWSEHYKAITDHGNDWAALIEGGSSSPLLVAGDFNQTRDGSERTYGTIRGGQYLSDHNGVYVDIGRLDAPFQLVPDSDSMRST